METAIPFSGFYDSIHSEHLERILYIDEDSLSHDEDSPNYGKTWDEVSATIDWKKEHETYCEQYVKALSEMVNIPLSFKLMQSPREYNFTTDRIFCDVSEDVYNTIKERGLIHKEALAKLVEDHFTSGPGFSSFYSNDLDAWLAQDEKLDHNQLCTFLECILMEEHGDEWEIYLLEDINW